MNKGAVDKKNTDETAVYDTLSDDKSDKAKRRKRLILWISGTVGVIGAVALAVVLLLPGAAEDVPVVADERPSVAAGVSKPSTTRTPTTATPSPSPSEDVASEEAIAGGEAEAATDSGNTSSGGSSGSVSTGGGSASSSAGGSSSGGSAGGSTGGGSASTGGGNSGSGAVSTPAPDPNAGKTWHEAVTEQVWIVDSPARQEPIYATRVVCSCGEVFNTVDEWHVHNKALGRGNGHAYSTQDYISGYNTIPEQGHWETRVVREARWY